MLKQTPASLLTQFKIDQNQPGTILRDFETLLDFIGPEGVRASGKFHFLPLGRLLEVDSLMTNPVRPRLQRPQQCSLPHIHGLYLLIRTLQIAVPQGKGKTSGRLVLDPVMVEQWRSLNPVEQYFNLLEAWLLHATEETLGEPGGWLRPNLLADVIGFANRFRTSTKIEIKDGDSPFYGIRSYYQLALGELFGLWEVKTREPKEGQGWIVRQIQQTTIGTALLDLITKNFIDLVLRERIDDENPPSQQFGQLKKVVGAAFPDWKRTWEFPTHEFRKGVYSFKVSVQDSWRRIAVPSDTNLSEVASAILDAFGFDEDHLYEFTLREPDGRTRRISHDACDAEEFADETQVGDLPLREMDSMEFHYDLCDDWKFEMNLEKIAPPNKKLTKPKVVERRGRAPKQYPSWEVY